MNHLIYSVEDDKNISSIINQSISKLGFEIVSFYDGKTFLDAFKKKKPDMVLLDMMLPDISGEEILKQIREDEENGKISIIIITANRLITDKVKSFDLGADDYIEKPFHILELMSRVQAKFRKNKNKSIIKIKDKLTINLSNYEVLLEGQKIILTNKEFQILAYLAQRKNEVVSRDEIQKHIWKTDSDIESRAIDMHVLEIRRKIKDKDKTLIKTIYGVGFTINA